MDEKRIRIRMLKSLATGRNYYEEGRVYEAPMDLPDYLAISWIRSGVAEEEKSIDRAPETKSEAAPETKGPKKKRVFKR